MSQVEVNDTTKTAFGAAFAEWMSARADMATLDIGGFDAVDSPEEEDARVDEVVDRCARACSTVTTVPATTRMQLIQKIDVVQAALEDRERIGRPCDNSHLMLFAGFKCDLENFLRGLSAKALA